MATRTETQLTTISPQERSATGVNTYVQHYADPAAGQGLQQLSKALGIASDSAGRTKDKREKEFENNLEYYAAQFSKDKELGLVDATQVRGAYPQASPIVAGKITELIGKQWASDYARSELDAFLADDSVRLNPEARRAFIDGLRQDIAKQVEGRPFFGQGAISAAESIIREYEGSLQREAAGYHRELQEEDFKSGISSGLLFTPSTEAAGEAAGLLDFIAGPESNGNYNAYYEHAGNRTIQFTGMTVDEVIAWQRDHVAKGNASSSVGRYQIILDTMRHLKKTMGLSGSERFSPELQDKMAIALLERRGYSDFKAGRITKEEFANSLAEEWAGLPMVSGSKAGQSAYAGDGLNSAGVGVNDFLSILDTPGQRMSPVDQVDRVAAETSSINPIRRRELVVDTAINLALSERDTSILERIPENMRGMPEVEAKIERAAEQVRDLQWQDYTRQQQIQDNNRKKLIRDTRQEMLDRIASGERINPAEYAKYGGEVYDYAVKVQNDEFIDPVASAAETAALRDSFLQGSTTGGTSDLIDGNLTYEEAVDLVQTHPGLTAADRRRLIDDLPTLLDGMNLMNDPQISSFYSNRIGTDVQVYLQSVAGSINKLQGNNIAGTVRRTFDETVRTHVRASIEDGEGIPRGMRLVEILEKAEEKALRKLDSLQQRSSNPAPSAPQAGEQDSQSPVNLSDEDAALLNKYLPNSESKQAPKQPAMTPIVPFGPEEAAINELRKYLEGN